MGECQEVQDGEPALGRTKKRLTYFSNILPFLSVSSLGWPRRTYAHEPGATAVAGKFGSAFSAGRLSTDDLR